MKIANPFKLKELLWPHIKFYKQQEEIIQSVIDNDETIVPAGNMLGKDFVSAFIVLTFFLCRLPYKCRILTTSVDASQLTGVLWGEIGRFIQEARNPLDYRKGGPLVVNHMLIRKVTDGNLDRYSYIMGRVAARGEGMLGHHAPTPNMGTHPTTLFVTDEASGVDDVTYDRGKTWAHRTLIIGNPYPCTNFFYRGVKGKPPEGGDLKTPDGKRFIRKVIRIKGDESPNVRYGLAQKAAGIEPTNDVIVPGVLPYGEYVNRRTNWDKIRQQISLDAEFYEGSQVLLFPPQWLDASEQVYRTLVPNRQAEVMGIDSAAGGDNTAFVIADKLGVIAWESYKTPDTAFIPKHTLHLMDKYRIPPTKVWYDAGGGGKQHADRLRDQGFNVKTIAFGESVAPQKRRGQYTVEQRVKQSEEHYAYVNRRAQMYGLLSNALDPSVNDRPFALPPGSPFRAQLAPIPRLYDKEGRLFLPPKNKRKMADGKDGTEQTLIDMIGHSPDESDALVMCIFGMFKQRSVITVGAF